MSNPHLDITISAYRTLRDSSYSRLQTIAESAENNEEIQLLRKQISILDELINISTEVRGEIDQ